MIDGTNKTEKMSYSIQDCLTITTNMYNGAAAVYGNERLGRNPVVVMMDMISVFQDSSKAKVSIEADFLRISNSLVFKDPLVFHHIWQEIIDVCVRKDHLFTDDESKTLKKLLMG